MIKNKGKKSLRKEDILNVAQPLQPNASESKLEALKAEARSMGRGYWIRASIGLLFVIFFATFVPNAYLQYRYSDVFQESPCKLCQDLNNQSAMCFFSGNYSIVPKTSWLTLHPMKEMRLKARWLQIPCDVCGEVEGGGLQACLNSTFHPQNKNQKIDNLNLSIIPEGDISS